LRDNALGEPALGESASRENAPHENASHENAPHENAPRELVLSKTECEAIAHRVLQFATADDTRVTITSAVRGNTRFAVNHISTSGDDVNTTVTIQSTVGTRSASLTTNALDEAALAAAVRHAEAIAAISSEDPEYMPALGPQTYAPVAATPAVMPTPADRASAVAAVVDRAQGATCVASGYLEARYTATAFATSRGLFGYERRGAVSMTTTVRTPDGTGSGWAGASANDWSDIDAAALGAHATEKANRSRLPVAVEPGKHTVVLEPTAVGNLVQLIGSALSARAADEGRSFFAKPGGGNKIGLQVVDRRVTLLSDPADAGGRQIANDGLPAQRVVWIDNGVVTQLSYDRYWAQRTGHAPTAAPEGTLRMSGGTASLHDMIAATERGILVTRFWYIRAVDPRTILYTGLTRDGTFLIEHGTVTRAVKNFRYNESPIFLLNNVEMLGVPTRVNAGEDGGPGATIIVPALKCRDFTFTSISDAV
jgi:predicted Zn-dependent protease